VPLFASRPSNSGSQWPLGLRWGIFSTSRKLGSDFQIPLKEQMSVFCCPIYWYTRVLRQDHPKYKKFYPKYKNKIHKPERREALRLTGLQHHGHTIVTNKTVQFPSALKTLRQVDIRLTVLSSSCPNQQMKSCHWIKRGWLAETPASTATLYLDSVPACILSRLVAVAVWLCCYTVL